MFPGSMPCLFVRFLLTVSTFPSLVLYQWPSRRFSRLSHSSPFPACRDPTAEDSQKLQSKMARARRSSGVFPIPAGLPPERSVGEDYHRPQQHIMKVKPNLLLFLTLVIRFGSEDFPESRPWFRTGTGPPSHWTRQACYFPLRKRP